MGGGWGGLRVDDSGVMHSGSEVLSCRALPGDHGAGLGVVGGGGGGAELGETAVARLQAGHGTPEGRETETT